jgi:TPR repeat protein
VAAAPRILHTLASLTAIPLAMNRWAEQSDDSEPSESLPRAQPTAHRAAPQEVLLPSDDLALPDDRLPPRPARRIARWWIAPAALLVAVVIGLAAFVKARASRPDGTDAYVGSGRMGVSVEPGVQRATPDSVPVRVDSGFLRIGGDLPAGATVTIDDLPLTQESLSLVPGEYVLAAGAPGYESFSERLTLEPGQTLLWTPTLSRADTATVRSANSATEPRRTASAAKKPEAAAKNVPAKADSPTVAAAQPVAQSCQEAFDAKSWPAAATLCAKEARAGSVTAQRNLGVMYDRGVGVERDPALAARGLRAAAESGNRDAAVQLGAMDENGRGVAADPAQSVSWYRRAALLGDREAQVKVGKAYEAGAGVASDMGEALTWYRKAAGQGDAWAQNYIGFLYGNGKGVPHDDIEALKWFRQAATNGNAQAEYNVGFMYANGRGVRRDDAEAVRWYRLAARDGYDEAKRELERRGIEP